MLFIVALLQLWAYRDFKHFWCYGMEQESRHDFTELPGCSRFVALMPRWRQPDHAPRTDRGKLGVWPG